MPTVSIDCVTAFLAEQATIKNANNDGTPSTLDPFTFKAANNDVHFGQMLKDPDQTKLEEGMKKEVDDLIGLIDSSTFKVVPRSYLPEGNKPVRAICWRAHPCPSGREQEHRVIFWETYAPVVM